MLILIEFSTGLSSVSDVYRDLEEWSRLRFLPRCWEVVQPLLCATFLPKCTNDTQNSVELPGYDLCAITRDACAIVGENNVWPDYLNCDATHFQHGCRVSAAYAPQPEHIILNL